MNKIQIMGLTDYLTEPNELNLKLFVMGINPNFNLTSKKKAELTNLILKYKSDPNKLRLTAIEIYLEMSNLRKKQTKQAQSVKPISEPVQIPVLNGYTPEHESKLLELDLLRSEFISNLKNQSPGTINRQIDIKEEMRKIEIEIGLFNGTSDMGQYLRGDGDSLESKRDLFVSIFGDYNTPGTAGWSLINPNGMSQFSVSSTAFAAMWNNPDDKNVFSKYILEITGKKMQPYIITENKTVSPSQWIFGKQAVSFKQTLRDDAGKIYGAEILDKMQLAETFQIR